MQKDCKECGKKIAISFYDKNEKMCTDCSLKLKKCAICCAKEIYNEFVTRCRSCLIDEHGMCETCKEPRIGDTCRTPSCN